MNPDNALLAAGRFVYLKKIQKCPKWRSGIRPGVRRKEFSEEFCLLCRPPIAEVQEYRIKRGESHAFRFPACVIISGIFLGRNETAVEIHYLTAARAQHLK